MLATAKRRLQSTTIDLIRHIPYQSRDEAIAKMNKRATNIELRERGKNGLQKDGIWFIEPSILIVRRPGQILK